MRSLSRMLETGRVVLAGARDALLADARVQRAYLGAGA
jgi:ABC-type branched-subunit amino acid transport system ATPase component